ncbi:penicillin-binding protein [Granulicella mallensis]|uniref:Cell division protein FtsI (Penicillin-binding protein 3) n=1 Tax=Granulicella mallensis TaxID=940614 RepID=A0A7W7ZVW4_9BACT|nr:penicillin-binding protein [Granulicella mallensis]MBB5066807.1 cell division protein FtsI (penicillin-binding protein 3) [Granulicella mallensis]
MKSSPRKALTAPIRRVRFVYVAMVFCLWVVAIAFRLGWLQIVRHGEFVKRAAEQQQRTFEVAPRRGVLYDRNLRELAMTVLVDSVYAVPSEVGDNRAEDAALLAKVVHTDSLDHLTTEQQILARMNASKHFAWVARKLDPETAERVKELNLKGIYLQKEFKRFYPNADLAAHVLGYVGTDDAGLGGLEREFDDELHGTPGHMLTALDAKRHVLGSEESDPMPGENLVLTIDSNIQYMAERALDAQVAKVKALHGTIVVQDPHTGQILALAVSPRFNPNDSRHLDADSLTNLAVSDIYEPGSTFKLVTYSAALDGAGVKPTDMVDCQGGSMTMFGRTLHDDKADHYGVITVQKALEESSDVGAAKMALKLGPDKFYEYMKAFGFGQRSGIELPSETRGLLRPPRKWGSTSILSLAIGQEVGVTPVQLVSMVSAIANGGTYIPPHVLLQSTDQMKGDPRLHAAPFHPVADLPETLPDGSHRVIKPFTAAEMRSIMEGIVTEGTGKSAALNGYSSAGKTGTAEKIDPATHTYSHTKLVASFAGFAPVNNPAISVAVVIDTPTTVEGYGGIVSAPVFSQLAQEVLEYLGIAHDRPLKTQQQMAQIAASVQPEDVQDSADDLSAMFDQINSLPADDPLRQPANAAAMVQNQAADAAQAQKDQQAATQAHANSANSLSEKVLAAFHANGNTTSVIKDEKVDAGKPIAAPTIQPQVQEKSNGGVVVDAGKRVAVPDFHGADLRAVVEHAGSLGLRVQPIGSGLAREQAPAAGTMVPLGTQVVVRFAR